MSRSHHLNRIGEPGTIRQRNSRATDLLSTATPHPETTTDQGRVMFDPDFGLADDANDPNECEHGIPFEDDCAECYDLEEDDDG